MDCNQLKEKGNGFIKEGKYHEALNCYTAALAHNSSSHTVLSNRSLAFSKVGKFKEALDDANKCIDIAPDFGRGYLRKATALNFLGTHGEAILAAAEGYKCRQSDTVCKECVSQWLLANQALHRELISQASETFGTPTGILILSEKSYTILRKVSVSRASTGMTRESMSDYLLDVVKEMHFLLGKFGHKIPSSVSDWIHSLSLTSTVDPQTDSIPKEVTDQVIQKGSEFSKCLMASIDPVLHPVLCPLVVFCVMIINGRSYTLDCTNSGHHERYVLSKSLLPLFKSGVLRGERYTVHHLCTFVGLLGSFHGRRTPLTAEHIQPIRTYCQEMRMILAKLSPSVWEYNELKKVCLGALAIAEQDADDIRPGHGDIYVTAGVEAMAKVQFGDSSPSMIVSSVNQCMEEVKCKHPELFTVDDAEYLLNGSCKLIRICYYG